MESLKAIKARERSRRKASLRRKRLWLTARQFRSHRNPITWAISTSTCIATSCFVRGHSILSR